MMIKIEYITIEILHMIHFNKSIQPICNIIRLLMISFGHLVPALMLFRAASHQLCLPTLAERRICGGL